MRSDSASFAFSRLCSGRSARSDASARLHSTVARRSMVVGGASSEPRASSAGVTRVAATARSYAATAKA